MRRIWPALVLGLVLGCAAAPRPNEEHTTPHPPAVAVPALEVSVRTSETAPAPVITAAPVKDDAVLSFMKGMSLRDRIAQRFIIYIPRDYSLEETGTLLRENRPGGVILYRWNYDSARDVRILSRHIKSSLIEETRGITPFICADQEGGRVTAFRFDGMVRLPSQYDIGRRGNANLVRMYAYVNALQMMELGCNMNLAPVLDLTDDGDRSIIGDRSFGSDPELVSSYARAYIDAARSAGLITVAKHFPGHGITRIDSHSRLPVIDAPPHVLEEHLRPFRAAVDAGIGAVMTAHILYPGIDRLYPATLSRKILHDILRKELGFGGVIMSDGLEMGAISRNYPVKETLKTAIIAGVDILLLYTRYPVGEMIALVEELVAEGHVTEEDINRGTERILRLKQEFGLLDAGI